MESVLVVPDVKSTPVRNSLIHWSDSIVSGQVKTRAEKSRYFDRSIHLGPRFGIGVVIDFEDSVLSQAQVLEGQVEIVKSR